MKPMNSDEMDILTDLTQGTCTVLYRLGDSYVRLGLRIKGIELALIVEFDHGSWHIWAPHYKWILPTENLESAKIARLYRQIASFPSTQKSFPRETSHEDIISTFGLEATSSLRHQEVSVSPLEIPGEQNDETASDFADILNALAVSSNATCGIVIERISGTSDVKYSPRVNEHYKPAGKERAIFDALDKIAKFYRPRGHKIDALNGHLRVYAFGVDNSFDLTKHHPSSHQRVRARRTLVDFFKRISTIGLITESPEEYVETLTNVMDI